ncbi:MAG: glutamate dehydrogenase, partial [Candidatus Methanosuratincola sp.]
SSGTKIVAVSDSKGGIYNKDGLNVNAVADFKAKTGSVANFPGAKSITNEELLEAACDILIPAALENQINASNADKINAKLVAEGANGPIAPEADEILFQKGIMVIPDILANAGGVSTSYFEWVQNLQNYYWTLEEVRTKLDALMVKAFNNVYEKANKHKIDMRMGAYACAVDRVVRAMKLRGWI